MSPSSRSRLYPFLHSTTGTAPSLSNLRIRSISSIDFFFRDLSGQQPITRTTEALCMSSGSRSFPTEQRLLFGWCGRWFLFSWEVLLDGWPVKVHATLFTHVMTSEISSICCSRFENETRMQTRRCAHGGIAWVRRRRHG